MEDEKDLLEVENPDENLDSNQEESEDEVEARLAKAEEIAKNQRIRAEKAEKELKALKGNAVKKEEEVVAPKNDLTPKDYLALTENKITSEDFDEVVRIASVLGKSISETLKDKTAQAILKGRQEERATAEATSTATSRRKSGQNQSERLLSNLQKGELPETEEDARALAEAQFKQLFRKN